MAVIGHHVEHRPPVIAGVRLAGAEDVLGLVQRQIDQALGYSFLYYENIDGGHSAAANLGETATRVSLEYTYLMQRLMD